MLKLVTLPPQNVTVFPEVGSEDWTFVVNPVIVKTVYECDPYQLRSTQFLSSRWHKYSKKSCVHTDLDAVVTLNGGENNLLYAAGDDFVLRHNGMFYFPVRSSFSLYGTDFIGFKSSATQLQKDSLGREVWRTSFRCRIKLDDLTFSYYSYLWEWHIGEQEITRITRAYSPPTTGGLKETSEWFEEGIQFIAVSGDDLSQTEHPLSTLITSPPISDELETFIQQVEYQRARHLMVLRFLREASTKVEAARKAITLLKGNRPRNVWILDRPPVQPCIIQRTRKGKLKWRKVTSWDLELNARYRDLEDWKTELDYWRRRLRAVDDSPVNQRLIRLWKRARVCQLPQWGEAEQELWYDLYHKVVPPKTNWLEYLQGLKDMPGMVRDWVGDLKKIPSLKRAVGWYLEWIYAIRPLPEDTAIVSQFEDRLKSRLFEDGDRYSSLGVYSTGDWRGISRLQVKMGPYAIPNLALPEGVINSSSLKIGMLVGNEYPSWLGKTRESIEATGLPTDLYEAAAELWALFPMSFVIDWFFHVEASLHELHAANAISRFPIAYVCRTLKVKRDEAVSVREMVNEELGLSVTSVTATRDVYTRQYSYDVGSIPLREHKTNWKALLTQGPALLIVGAVPLPHGIKERIRNLLKGKKGKKVRAMLLAEARAMVKDNLDDCTFPGGVNRKGRRRHSNFSSQKGRTRTRALPTKVLCRTQ